MNDKIFDLVSKKILVVLMALVSLGSLSGCGNQATQRLGGAAREQIDSSSLGSGVARIASTNSTFTSSNWMELLWNKQAHFQEVANIGFSVPGAPHVLETATSQVVVRDGVWYAFNRQIDNTIPNPCGEPYMRMVVRSSPDQGRTWSNPVTVAEPLPGMNFASCIVTDASVYYDAEINRWLLITQCLGFPDPGKPAHWTLCLFVRDGASPMGAFAPFHHNPVVRNGQLLRPYCSQPGKSCHAGFGDEGTPEIIYKLNGEYIVTFHGYDGVRGIRAAAATPDFVNWRMTGPGLPDDILFSTKDCEKWGVAWQGGCIGGGGAKILRSPHFHYMLIEAADKNLACQEGQNWVMGLVRAQGLAGSGQWDSVHTNPIMVNETSTICGLQYQNIFEDRGEIFLMLGYQEDVRYYPNKLFKLVPGRGPDQIRFAGKDTRLVQNVALKAPEVHRAYTDILGREPSEEDWIAQTRVLRSGIDVYTFRLSLAQSQEGLIAIDRIYRVRLGRGADDQGLAHYQQGLASGWNLGGIDYQLANSAEATGGRHPAIRDAYLQILGREPHLDGWQNLTAQLNAGVPLTTLRNYLAGSDEAVARLHDIYREVLGREGDLQGLVHFQQQLTAGASLSDVRQTLINSEEYQVRLAQLTVIKAFAEILDRSISNEDLAAQAGVFRSIGNVVQYRLAVATSPEGVAKLDQVYWSQLGRGIDPGGLAVWQQSLANGATLSQVAQALYNSPEAIARR